MVVGDGERGQEPQGAGVPTSASRPRRRRRDTAQVERDARLAELVAGLTGSPLGGALHAVVHDDGPRTADALEVVARAMVRVDQPPPKELRLDRYDREHRPTPGEAGATTDDGGDEGDEGEERDEGDAGPAASEPPDDPPANAS